MNNLSDKITGKAKQVKAKISDDKKLQVEGKFQEKKADLTDTFYRRYKVSK